MNASSAQPTFRWGIVEGVPALSVSDPSKTSRKRGLDFRRTVSVSPGRKEEPTDGP